MWMFKIGDEENQFPNLTYTQARSAAIKIAKEKGLSEIEILP